MSILIKGIRIPKCDWTRILILLPDGRCIDEFGNTLEVVALPPHGRLIDADALAMRLGITDMDCYKCEWGNHGFCGRGSEFSSACEALEDAPTIIEAEREP